MQNQEAALKSLENQVGQISHALNTRQQGGFPSNTEVAKGATHEQCKAITTSSVRNLQPPIKSKQGEKTADNPNVATVPDKPASAVTPTPVGEDHQIPLNPKKIDPAATSPQPKPPRTDTLKDTRPPPPFPQRLKKQKHEYQFKKFFDILKHVHINLPLVEALQ
ncbi:hypothetical protein V6N12_029022 [Hibiscus sabdariffa]|uniref:Reverse transcriptase domain-containing protein n=1 Tax=Hibiscus sabdariffa TaxID=183260 RepID=A0ABR2F7L8_9ROSI